MFNTIVRLYGVYFVSNLSLVHIFRPLFVVTNRWLGATHWIEFCLLVVPLSRRTDSFAVVCGCATGLRGRNYGRQLWIGDISRT
jgi:hypothetical protein